MKKLLGIVVLGLLLSGNAYAKKGSGELKLSKTIMTEFLVYLYGASNPKYSDGANKKNHPMLMTISKDGKSSHYYYCPYAYCEDGNYVYQSIKKCEKRSNGSPCFLFAKKRKIVWNNGIDIKSKKRSIKKKLLKEPYEIAKIIQDLGFYDNDISKLPGINYDTAKIEEDTNITGEKDNYDYPSLIASLTSSHKSDWKEYVEYDYKYKVWFMAKRKDKDMTYSWQTGNNLKSTEKKGFDRCNNFVKEKPKRYPKDVICILYYKGTTPTTDNEKIMTAQTYYGVTKANLFFEKYPYVLNDIKSGENKQQLESSIDIVEKLKELNSLLESGIISAEEFEKAKKKILN